MWFASGAPRAENIYGKVIIFQYPNDKNKPLTVKKTVSGEQPGEYFGAALTSCDLNGDGKDELIVGAPQWAKDIDEGRIYVFTTSHNVCRICSRMYYLNFFFMYTNHLHKCQIYNWLTKSL